VRVGDERRCDRRRSDHRGRRGDRPSLGNRPSAGGARPRLAGGSSRPGGRVGDRTGISRSRRRHAPDSRCPDASGHPRHAATDDDRRRPRSATARGRRHRTPGRSDRNGRTDLGVRRRRSDGPLHGPTGDSLDRRLGAHAAGGPQRDSRDRSRTARRGDRNVRLRSGCGLGHSGRTAGRRLAAIRSDPCDRRDGSSRRSLRAGLVGDSPCGRGTDSTTAARLGRNAGRARSDPQRVGRSFGRGACGGDRDAARARRSRVAGSGSPCARRR
jgi:hypothetical protein